MFENVYSDCEFCDSILIFFLLSTSEFATSFVVFLILKNSANENQSSSELFFSMKKKKFDIEKKIVFTSCSFVCFSVNSSVESLLVLVFFVWKLNCYVSFVWLSAFLSSRKHEFVQEEEKEFSDEKVVIENDVSNLCETCNSSFSSLIIFYVEVIKIEEKEERKKFFLF